MQMAAHAEGADHHDGMNGIARRLMHVGVGQRGSGRGGLFLHLLADNLLDQAPVAVERGDQLAIGLQRPVGLFPRCAFGVLLHRGGVVLQRGEEFLPLGVDRRGVVLPCGVERLDIIGVTAVEEGGE